MRGTTHEKKMCIICVIAKDNTVETVEHMKTRRKQMKSLPNISGITKQLVVDNGQWKLMWDRLIVTGEIITINDHSQGLTEEKNICHK